MISLVNNPRRVLKGFDDQQGSVSSALLGPSAWSLDAYRDTGFLIPCLRHDQNDLVGLIFQFTHRKKLDTTAILHLHYVPLANASGNVYFSWYYHWGNLGSELPAISSWTSGNTTIPIQASDQYKKSIYNIIANISPPAEESFSSELFVKLIRSGTDPLDTYNSNKDHATLQANLGITYLDCHIGLDKNGSVEPTHD